MCVSLPIAVEKRAMGVIMTVRDANGRARAVIGQNLTTIPQTTEYRGYSGSQTSYPHARTQRMWVRTRTARPGLWKKPIRIRGIERSKIDHLLEGHSQQGL